MFSMRLNVPLRFKNRTTFPRFVKSTINLDNEKTTIKFNNNCRKSLIHDVTDLKFLFTKFSSLNIENLPNLQFVRTYSSDAAAKRENVFGELGDRQFEKVEMDEDEKKEEKFVENEARVSMKNRLTPGGYANLIKSHIQKGNLDAALEVLDKVAENRDEPTTYMYNLLLRAFAVIGNFKQSRRLYVMMKKRGIKCNPATYTSILNACANYHHSGIALDYLAELRQEFVEKGIILNETHYNAMIKAYGRHGVISEAFAIADEMRDKRLSTNEITFNSLLIGTISNRDAGLRHALVVWHLMRRHAIKPTITTYNLLFRAIRDTKLGDIKIFDVLISSPPQCQILLNEETGPNLLARTPSVNSLIFRTIVATNEPMNEDNERENLSSDDENLRCKEENLPETISAKKANLPATIDSTTGENSLVDGSTDILKIPLETIHNKNRLILFGGVTGILESMEKDGVVPDTKSITLLMDLLPPSSQAEHNIIKTAKKKKIPLDIDFYNMLMKKRSLRKDYAGAKEILDDIQRSGLCPDIITWGILALGCHTLDEARDFIGAMKATGHRLNVVIIGTLINNACHKLRFGYILEMMEIMRNHRIQPNWQLYKALDDFQKEMNDKIKSKKFSRTVNHPGFKIGFSKFNTRYPTWRQEMESEKEEKKPKRKFRQR